MKTREPFTSDELMRAFRQVRAANEGPEDDVLTDTELRAYGYDDGFMDFATMLTSDLLAGSVFEKSLTMQVEVSTAVTATACIVGQVLNNRESEEES